MSETQSIVTGRFNTSLEKAMYFSNLAKTAVDNLLNTETMVNVLNYISTIISNMDSVIQFNWIANPLSGYPLPPPVFAPPLGNITVTEKTEPNFVNTAAAGYSSALSTLLSSTLQTFVNGNETGLTESVEDDEFNLLMMRQADENQKLYDTVEAQNEALGWCMPQASYMAGMAEVANRINQKATEINIAVNAKREEMIQKNRQHAMTVSVDLEKSLMSYLVELSKEDIQRYQADIAKFNAVLDGQVKYAEVMSKRNDNLVKLYDAQVRDRESVFRSVTQAYAEEVKETIGRAEVLLKREVSKIETWAALYKTKDEVVRAWGAILAQIASAIWGSVSASAALHFNESTSDSTSNSHSDSYSRSDSLSYNYNFSKQVD